MAIKPFHYPTTTVGSSTTVPVLTVDSRGVIKSVSSASISSSGGGGGADSAASYVVISATGSLSNERVLTAGTGISIGDGGAGGNVTISTTGAPPTGPAGGDLEGNYPNPTIGDLAVTPAKTDLTQTWNFTGDLQVDGTAVVVTTDPRLSDDREPTGSAGGDLAGSYPNPTLAAITTAATSGSASVVPVVTVDAKGRVTGMSSANIAIAQSAVTNLTTDLSNLQTTASNALTTASNAVPLSAYSAADRYLYSTAASTVTTASILSGWRNFLATTKATWDETNGRLGINGTPSVKLHLLGTSATTDIARFDQGIDFSRITRPNAPTLALAGAGAGNVNSGSHSYWVSFYSATGETELSNYTTIGVADPATDGKVVVTFTTSSDYRTIGRRIYRTAANITYYDDAKLLATIANNTDTTYTDNIADASRPGTSNAFYRENTTNRIITVAGSAAMILTNATTALGQGALAPINAGTAIGGLNTAIGVNAGAGSTLGSRNTLIGNAAGYYANGGDNIAIGDSTGQGIQGGGSNIYMGRNAAYFGSGSANIGIGPGALFGANGFGPSFNLALGNNAGFGIRSGGFNTFIGHYAGNDVTSGSSNIIIGSYSRVPLIGGNRQLNIANTIYGTNIYSPAFPGSSTPVAAANIGIGLTTPTARLQLAAGTTTAASAPLKFTSGSLLATPESGSVEFDGNSLYFTSGSTRDIITNKVSRAGDTMTGNLNISAGNQLFLQGVGNLRLGVGFSAGSFSNANAVVEFKPSTSSRFTFLDNVNGALKNPVLSLCNLDGAGKGMALYADSNSSAFIYSDNGNFDITSDTKARIEASTFGLGTLRFRVDNSGSAYVTNKMYVGGTVVPTALIHLKAGTSTATTSPLKFTSGSLLATPESGSVEFNGDKLYLTITSSTARKEFTLNDSSLTAGQQPTTTTNGRLTNSNKYSIYATGTTNGSAGSSTNLTLASLPNSGDMRFVRITVKALSNAFPPDAYGRTIDAMWANAMGTLSQIGADQLGTALATGDLTNATIATTGSGTTLQVKCTDVDGCAATVTWEVFGEYY